VHLSPAEQDRLTIFMVAELARRRLTRGSLVSAPEAIALITDAILEAAWDGSSMAEAEQAGRAAVDASHVQPGAAGLLRHIEVDALFPSGTALVAIDDPLGPPDAESAGAMRPVATQRALNVGRSRVELDVVNVSDATVRVSSHYPFWEANRALRFDRDMARGHRLDIPAGTSVGFEPNSQTTVRLVSLGGRGQAPLLQLDDGTPLATGGRQDQRAPSRDQASDQDGNDDNSRR
jgi:urease subunit gamma/beta